MMADQVTMHSPYMMGRESFISKTKRLSRSECTNIRLNYVFLSRVATTGSILYSMQTTTVFIGYKRMK
jgi:hypothetical protein